MEDNRLAGHNGDPAAELMSKRPRLILRILSALTGFEAVGGLCFIGMTLLAFPAVRETFGSQYPHLTPAYVVLVSFNCAFVFLLFLSAAFLWRLQRRGLSLLLMTLGFEVLYIIGLVVAINFLGLDNSSKGLGTTLGVLSGVGNMAVGFQIVTAYPLIAAAFVFVGYRYLGIPARAVEQKL